jgi:hypothetical protein
VAGVGLAAMGLVSLWAAIDITAPSWPPDHPPIVITGFALAGAVFTTIRPNERPSRLSRRILLAAVAATISGIVVQNVPA